MVPLPCSARRLDQAGLIGEMPGTLPESGDRMGHQWPNGIEGVDLARRVGTDIAVPLLGSLAQLTHVPRTRMVRPAKLASTSIAAQIEAGLAL